MIIVRNPLRRLPVLFFLDGVLAVFLIGVTVGAHREDRLLEGLKGRIETEAGSNPSSVATVLGAMHVTHEFVGGRAVLFPKEGGPAGGWHSGLADQLSGQADFGSYSKALARLLIYCGYPVRIGQMKVGGHFGGHIFVETRVDGRWVVLDPLYDLAFRRPDSSLADFADLNQDWTHFATQTPPGYTASYRYEAVRYTKWDLLRVYDLYFYAGLLVFILLNIYLYRGVRGSLPWQKAALQRMIEQQGKSSSSF